MKRLLIILASLWILILHGFNQTFITREGMASFYSSAPLTVRTFRSLKIVNMHSVEIPYQNELIFTIGHRFGNVRKGIYELFGLDNATIRIGFDYGINQWLGVGIGRSTFEKTYDLYGKARLIEQVQNGSPLSLT